MQEMLERLSIYILENPIHTIFIAAILDLFLVIAFILWWM